MNDPFGVAVGRCTRRVEPPVAVVVVMVLMIPCYPSGQFDLAYIHNTDNTPEGFTRSTKWETTAVPSQHVHNVHHVGMHARLVSEPDTTPFFVMLSLSKHRRNPQTRSDPSTSSG
jgi:hypothetical protein